MIDISEAFVYGEDTHILNVAHSYRDKPNLHTLTQPSSENEPQEIEEK
jgi:hypothetical protein